MFGLFLPLSFLIPSTSGLATLSMPITAPLAGFVDVPASLVVTAYQSASGIMNLFIPTSAVVMGGLAIARVPYGTYLRWVWPLLLALTGLCVVVLGSLGGGVMTSNGIAVAGRADRGSRRAVRHRPDRLGPRARALPRRRRRQSRHEDHRGAAGELTAMIADVSAALRGLEPQACWRHFEALTRIPRPSLHEEPVIEHVRTWAAANGFELRQDAARNVVVRVPASAGRESASTVILQGHLDMVCERTPDSPNDPAEGRIELVRDGDWLTADGTTLGADNGIGVAAMMALAEDPSLPHGPLELLMTVGEEVGGEGVGASGLDPSLVTGTTLLNLDSEEDGKLTVGSASSTDTSIRVEAAARAL